MREIPTIMQQSTEPELMLNELVLEVQVEATSQVVEQSSRFDGLKRFAAAAALTVTLLPAALVGVSSAESFDAQPHKAAHHVSDKPKHHHESTHHKHHHPKPHHHKSSQTHKHKAKHPYLPEQPITGAPVMPPNPISPEQPNPAIPSPINPFQPETPPTPSPSPTPPEKPTPPPAPIPTPTKPPEAPLPVPLTLDYPSSVAVDNAGNLYVANPGGNQVEELTPSGNLSVFAGADQPGPETPGAANRSALYGPSAVAINSNTGDIYIADVGNDVVDEVTPTGQLSIFAGVQGKHGTPTAGPAIASELFGPISLAVDPYGNNNSVYIGEEGDGQAQTNATVEKVTPDGQLSIFAGETAMSGMPTPGLATSSELGYPEGLAVNKHGQTVYIADVGASLVEQVSNSEGSADDLSIFAGTLEPTSLPPAQATDVFIDRPGGVAVDSAGDVFIADTLENEILRVTPSGNLSVYAGNGEQGAPTPGPATDSELDVPEGVAVDQSGNVYIADTQNNDIEKVTPTGQLSILLQ